MEDANLDTLFPRHYLDELRTKVPDSRHQFLSVGEFITKVTSSIEEVFPYVSVRGEVSGLSTPRSGHLYFSLKDETSMLRAVMFQSSVARSPYIPREGDEVVVSGRPTIYRQRGDFQIIVERVDPFGQGALEKAFEELKKRLEREGLFDPRKKQPLPQFPERVFVVTSPTGAAIRDFLKTCRERVVTAEIVLCPTRVQGQGADAEIAQSLDLIESVCRKGDVVLVTRGGGSKEDLWTYNSELLARRIAAFPVPVVSAVGHEIDITISDLVADQRASTPTHAAQVIFPERYGLLERLQGIQDAFLKNLRHLILLNENRLNQRLKQLRHPGAHLVERSAMVENLLRRLGGCIDQRVGMAEERVRELKHIAENAVHRQVTEDEKWLDVVASSLDANMDSHLNRASFRLKGAASSLYSLSPLKVLSRGYSIALTQDGTILKDSSQVRKDERLLIRPQKGKILCTVEEILE